VKNQWGGKRTGAGRRRTAHLRLMHLASCIEDWAAEDGNRRGSVTAALVDLYLLRYGNWTADDVAATGKIKPPDFESFRKTTKKDLRRGRALLREWRAFLRTLPEGRRYGP
jgi:hypothetical protein